MGVGASVGGLSSPLASARAGGAGAGQRVLSGLDSARLSAPGTINSVRAMALKNHARQENRYISQEGLSSRIRRRGEPRKADDSRSKYRGAGLRTKSGTGTEDGAADSGDEAEAEKNAETSGQTKISKTNTATEIVVDEGVVEGANENCTVPEEKEEEMDEDRDESIAEPSSKASSTLGSLTQFKLNMNLNLKIGLEDDNDWSKVSESGEDDDDAISLAQFDKGLVEVGDDNSEVSTRSQQQKRSSSSQLQYKLDGTLVVDGLTAGVGAEGIVRNERKDSRYPNVRKLPMRDRLTVLCKLGMGASSAVYKALDLTDMRLVALKMIRVNESNKRDQLVRELRSLFELLREHSRRSSIHMPKKNRRPEKYIVDFYDAFSNMEDGVVSLMIEYMDGGSLQDIVDEGGCDDEPTLANIAVQALKGLLFLHENYQIHRDLKPGNFLISHRGEVKVADLGILKQLPEPTVTKGTFGGTKVHLPKTNTFVGTTTYMSPERIDGKEYSFPADVWAFGLSIVTMALGRFPIDTQGGYWTILHGIRDAPPPTLPNTFSPECRDFVASCMQRNPDDRKTVQELLKHPFLLKTVVEDLTYDQSYERGKIELLSIVDAVNVHIKSLVEDVAVRRDAGQFGEEQIRQFDRVYGDLIDSKPIEVLQRLFFGVGEDSKARQNSTPKGRERERVRRIRPRLTNLAKQLHLPVDKVEMEARLYIESLA